MGSRGSSTGANTKQTTLAAVLLKHRIEEIQSKANEQRAILDGGLPAGGGGFLQKKQCFCCDEYTITERNKGEICSKCEWIDDSYQNKHPNSLNGKNPITLAEARKRYFGSKT